MTTTTPTTLLTLNGAPAFDELLATSDLPVLVDFWATWCGPCRALAPVVEEVAERFAGRVIVAKVDVDENREIALRHAIMAIPTLMLFRASKPELRLTGARSLTTLTSELEAVL